MPQEPKKRHSRQRQGKRRASIHLSIPKGIACPNCSAVTIPHQVCSKCGFYKGKEVIKQKVKKTEPEAAVAK